MQKYMYMERIHIGGLSKQVEDKSDLIDKFKSFGKVKDCEIVKDHSTGLYKGFAFLTLICDDKSWQRCQSILNGSKWKGSQLKLALAKESFLKKLEKERLVIEEVDDKSVRRRLGSHEAKDMTLIKDDIPEKKGWKKVRYGRAVCELKIRKNDGTLITIDPEKHQHQLKSFKKKEDVIAPIIDSIPLESLSWFIDDEKTYEDNSDKINLDKEQKSKLKQKESINKKTELLKKQKEGITAALSNIDKPR
ncbi:hypothetical protein K502DRAFT_81774 [Neoconidiobolus thromboides FSU 785]|nr:hypothetical protein K502DRAFT_81774 [Neoconidiobolus thromboides FSU 785]